MLNLAGPESLDYNGDAFQTGKELAFATEEECFTQAKETLSQLGIAVADSYDCFTLDSETLQAEAEKVRERLLEHGSKIYETGLSGAVMVRADGKKLKIKTMLPLDTD